MVDRLGLAVLVASLSLGACADDWVGPTAGDFEELCGKQAPVRLLAPGTDRAPTSVTTRRFGDRYVFGLRMSDRSEDRTMELWSAGECGEDPVRLIDGVDIPLRGGDPPWPDLPFVCEEASKRMLALDPRGLRPPHEVFEIRECFVSGAVATPRGLVGILGEGDTGPLVLQRWPEDPLSEAAEQVVLLAEAKARALPSPHTWPNEVEVMRVVDDEVFAITAADELVVVSLETLVVEVLAEGVRELEVGPLGRHVVWQGVEITNENPDWPEGPLFLLDRQSGQATQFDEAAMAYTLTHDMLLLEPLGLLHYRVGTLDDASADRWLRLDTLEPIGIPGLIWAWWPIDDTRAVFRRLHSSPMYMFDVSTGELTPLYDGPSHARHPGLDGILILQEDGGALIEVSFTGEIRTLARQVTPRWHPLSGDRIVTPYAVDDDRIGSLVVVDSATLEERYIDQRVHALSTSVFGEWPDGGDLISYMVVDDDPERHGIWLAKPAR